MPSRRKHKKKVYVVVCPECKKKVIVTEDDIIRI